MGVKTICATPGVGVKPEAPPQAGSPSLEAQDSRSLKKMMEPWPRDRRPASGRASGAYAVPSWYTTRLGPRRITWVVERLPPRNCLGPGETPDGMPEPNKASNGVSRAGWKGTKDALVRFAGNDLKERTPRIVAAATQLAS